MKLKSEDGTQIYYYKKTVKKPAQTLIFIHGGFMGNNTLLKNLYSKFKSCNILALDNRGTGDSEFPLDSKQSLTHYANDIKSLMQKEKLDQAIIIGVSFGGLVAQQFAKLYPKKVKKMVLISSTSSLHKLVRRTEVIYPLFKRSILVLDKVWLQKEKRKQRVDYSDLAQRMFHFRYGVRIIKNNSIKTILRRYILFFNIENFEIKGYCKSPVLIIQGKKDGFFKISDQNAYFNRFKRKTVIFIEGGHNIYMHRASELYPLIKSFLDS